MRPQFFIYRLAYRLRVAFASSLVILTCSGNSKSSAQSTLAFQNEATKTSSMPVQARWGRADPNGETSLIVSGLSELFEKQAHKLNFSKRELSSLLEQASPHKFSQVFPFRLARKTPENFFFENFGQRGFLVGEIDPQVPPLLASTDSADWLELRGPEHVSLAREFIPPLALNQGLRALGLQNPWLAEIFSATWSQAFEVASQIIENGGLKCWNKASTQKLYPNLADPTPQARCSTPLVGLTPEKTLPKQLPRKLGSILSPPLPSSTNLNAPPPVCVPMGRLASQSLELIGDEKAGHCLLWRYSLDERFVAKGLNSRLLCLNARYKTIKKTRFNSVVAVLPSSKPDVIHILESEDGLMTAHRLNLATLSVTKTELTTPAGQSMRDSPLPRRRTGLYACRQSAPSSGASALSNVEILGSNVDWLYVEETLFSGLRTPRPESDSAWRVRENFAGNLEVERLNWSQLQYDHPSITNERPFVCIIGREVDSKCGLRVLQTAVNMSEEWLNSDFDKNELSPAVQLSTAVLMAQSLEKLMLALPDWSLRPETEELLSVYTQKIKQLLENKMLSHTAISLDRRPKTFSPIRRYLDFPYDSQEYTELKKSLFCPNDFWVQLKQKSL